MSDFVTWVQSIFAIDNAEGIIALSALIAWLLPKLIYFLFKFIFSTLLFLANVFGRDKVELWLKQKLNNFLADLVEGAEVDDIPRWLNKDQLVLRELHWERGELVLDVPSVVITINLPTFGYRAVKLKLRYLFQREVFHARLRELLHNSVREVRIQEPSISYRQESGLQLFLNKPAEDHEKKTKTKEGLVALLRESMGYHLHVLLEHGSLHFTLGEEHFVVQNLNLDFYNRPDKLDSANFRFSLMLTGMYDGANISLYNKPASHTEYFLVANKLTVTSGLWKLLCERCEGLKELEPSQEGPVGVLREVHLAVDVQEQPRIMQLEGSYHIYKPRLKSWMNFEGPSSFEGKLGWNEHGLLLQDNFLVLQNGLRFKVPCTWKEGKLRMNFPGLEELKQGYAQVLENAKAGVERCKEKLLGGWKDKVVERAKDVQKLLKK